MKNTKKRGFTIVELVIVIAVIAILAAVLIPTFSNVITASKKSAAMQQARNAWTAYCADNAEDFTEFTGYIKWTVDAETVYWYKITAGQFEAKEADKPTTAGTKYFELSKNSATIAEDATASTIPSA